MTVKNSIRILFSLCIGLCIASLLVPSQALCAEQDDPTHNHSDAVKPPPPGMPSLPNFPNMPQRGMKRPPMATPKNDESIGGEIHALAAKPYRPSWAPITVFRGDTQAAGYLIPVCTSKNTADRARAAFILGQIGDKRAIKTLRKLLKDPVSEVQIQAAIALGEMGDGAGISKITKLFDDSQPWVKCYAVHALWNLNTKYARSFMLARQKNQPPIVAEIITRAANTTHTPYPAVKAKKTAVQKPVVKPKDMWFQANGVMIEESDYWWHKGNYNQSIRCLEAAIFLDLTDIESYSVIAWLQWSMGLDKTGIHIMNRCVADNPKNPEAFGELANYYTRSKRWVLAEWPLKRSIELGGDMQIRKTYAHCLEKLGKIEEAKIVWTQLKKDFPKDGAIDHNYKRIMGQTGQPV